MLEKYSQDHNRRSKIAQIALMAFKSLLLVLLYDWLMICLRLTKGACSIWKKKLLFSLWAVAYPWLIHFSRSIYLSLIHMHIKIVSAANRKQQALQIAFFFIALSCFINISIFLFISRLVLSLVTQHYSFTLNF